MNLARYTFALLVIFGGTHGICQTTDSEEKPQVEKQAEKVKLVNITLANDGIELQVPAKWKQKQPRSRIVERELEVAAAKGDKNEGRLTMMRSGGSVTQNVERWYGQFKQPDNKPTKDVAKVEKKKINGMDVVIVDISGTYKESLGGGPFAPGKVVERKEYRMLAGIVQTKKRGQYFFKLYGPQKTVASAAKSFMNMMDSVTSK